MKYEWKKEEKEVYLPKQKPVLVNVAKSKYFSIKGQGNPNSETFKEKVATLYQASYGVRMMHKTDFIPEGFFEYTVYPLEGIWDLTEAGRRKDTLDKNELIYKIMIKQPNFVTEEIFKKAIENQHKKYKNELLKDIAFEELEDGFCVQMMHIGSYDNEPETFKTMKEFIENNDLKIKTLVHKEIYISDARKTSAEKMQTVLRYFVSKV